MKTISETKVALYYNVPYEDKELICICESGEVALEEIHRLMTEWPEAFSDAARFIQEPIRYERRAY